MGPRTAVSLFVALLLLPASGARAAPAHVEAARDRVDWEQAGAEAVEVLSGYLATDTINPPGNEAAGAAYLAEVLDAAAIPWRLVEHGPGRASLVARVEGRGEARPLCLLSHIDVVPAEEDRWTVDPWAGVVRDGYVHGRGVLDMKGMGALELMTLVWLERLQVPLERDVILLAVADEEVDNVGMREVVEDHWGELDCGYVINEGGLGIRDAIFEGQALHPISVAEKGVLWLRMTAEGTSGHGSVEADTEAPGRLLQAMAAIDERRPRPRLVPSMQELLKRVGRHRGGVRGAFLRSGLLRGLFVKPMLMDEPATRAAMTDTAHLTGMRGASSVNVVPSRVRATYDCRLLPGTAPEEVLAELEHLTRDIEGIAFEVLAAEPSTGSPWRDDPLFDALARYAVEGRPHAVAGPFLSVGFTDSMYARQAGAIAYGYVPFEVSADEARTMHGHDERVSVDNVHEGLRRLFSTVVDFAGAR